MSQGAPFRPMKYPYTLTAKVAQFPYRYYVKHSWLYKYLLIGTLVSFPIFYKVQKLSYAPENVAKWDKLHREMFEGTGHH
ncbi:uncharacterized protein Roh [Temnothorax longispinosus]|uniref:Signal recognition particle receptor subunit alpha-like protein n=1 Tax=Temnothorax longispinosus TaxID=300112 RepID=A0A4S2KI23_9HYME|nr:Signal recognition particle receptor subunit alpha-like protein [Temnothorax longispinosus]